ncbi:MAG: hypothetical protein R6U70_08675 [Bacillota bacterium]
MISVHFTEKPRGVRPVVQRGPNYIFHLLAVARVGFAGEYAERYSDTVAQDDTGALKRLAEFLQLTPGCEGALAFLTVLLPAYLNLDSQVKITDYFSYLNDGLQSCNCFRFFNRYREGFARQRKWMYDVDHQWIADNHCDYAEEIAQLADIYARNYPPFEYWVWPTESRNLREVSARLNRLLADQPLIPQWQEMTGEAFEFSRFEIVLCAANEQGPPASTLGYDRTLFYYRHQEENLLECVSHEVGTHLLSAVFRKVCSGTPADCRHLCCACENLARHYNAVLLGRNPAYDTSEADVYAGLYRDLHRSQPEATPEQLLRAALRETAAAEP